MDITSSSQGSRFVPTAVAHARPTKTNSASVRLFLHAYDQYAGEVAVRTSQVTGENVISAETSKLMRMKYRVDAELLESFMDLGLLKDVFFYEKMEKKVLRDYLEL